jgi:hypothetical protein
MRVVLICLYARTVDEVDLEDPGFLENARRLISAQQIDSALCGPALAL